MLLSVSYMALLFVIQQNNYTSTDGNKTLSEAWFDEY